MAAYARRNRNQPGPKPVTPTPKGTRARKGLLLIDGGIARRRADQLIQVHERISGTAVPHKNLPTTADRLEQQHAAAVMVKHANAFDRAASEPLCGARTYASCEGHPGDFYVAMSAPLSLALRVANARTLTVELMRGDKRLQDWAIHLGALYVEEYGKRGALLRAAAAWEKEFGSLWSGAARGRP